MIRIQAFLLAALLMAGFVTVADAVEKSFAITNVRIFDGERMLDGCAAVLDGERVAAVVPEGELPRDIAQFTAGTYRSPRLLPEGGVLVVGVVGLGSLAGRRGTPAGVASDAHHPRSCRNVAASCR